MSIPRESVACQRDQPFLNARLDAVRFKERTTTRIILGLGTSYGPRLQLLLEKIAKMEWGEDQIFAICDQAKNLAYIHVELDPDGGEMLTRGLEPSPARPESTEPNPADGSIDWVMALKHWGSPIVMREAQEGSHRLKGDSKR